MARTTKLPRLARPMTRREARLLRTVIDHLRHCSNLAEINLGDGRDGRPEQRRKGWHAARAARYLQHAVHDVAGDLRELAGLIAAEKAHEKQPLTRQRQREVERHQAAMAKKYSRAA